MSDIDQEGKGSTDLDDIEDISIDAGLNLGDAFSYHEMMVAKGQATWCDVMKKRRTELEKVRKQIRNQAGNDLSQFDTRWSDVVEDEITSIRDLYASVPDKCIKQRLLELERTLERR